MLYLYIYIKILFLNHTLMNLEEKKKKYKWPSSLLFKNSTLKYQCAFKDSKWIA